ncbi:hypothetical protein Ddc_17700 [Ditylenchus destructor]|nr:hypothetical protein Ddc_17700 [Ditylenchus destructor]
MSPKYITVLIASIAIFANSITGFDVEQTRKVLSKFNMDVKDGTVQKVDIPPYFNGIENKDVKSVLDEASARDGFNLNIWRKKNKLNVVKAVARVINERSPYGQAIGVEDPVKPEDWQKLQNYLEFKHAYYMPIIGYEVLKERLRLKYDLMIQDRNINQTANNGSITVSDDMKELLKMFADVHERLETLRAKKEKDDAKIEW